jgi:hypothetical protein
MDAPHRKLSFLALGGTLGFLGCLLALHALSLTRPPTHLSDYANTRYGVLFFAGAYAFLLAVISAMLCLKRTLAPGWSTQAGVGFLLLSVPFGFLVATFPVDVGGRTTAVGEVHQWSVFPLFFFVTAAMLALVPGLRAHPRLRPLAGFSLGMGVMAALAMSTYELSELWHAPFVGAAQRVIVGAILAWFIGIAMTLARWPTENSTPVAVAAVAVDAKAEPAPEPEQS